MVATRRAGGQRRTTIAQSGRTRTPTRAETWIRCAGEGARPTLRRPRTAGEDERLRGPVHRDDAGFRVHLGADDYQAGFDKGKADGSPLEFTVTVTADDVDLLVDDRSRGRPGRHGHGTGAVSLTDEGRGGRFNLLVRDEEHAAARQMLYAMPLVTDDGRRFHLEGFKQIHDDDGLDLWKDTTLYVTVHEGDAAGPVAAKGIATIHMGDFAKQATTMKGIGGDGRADQAGALAKFGGCSRAPQRDLRRRLRAAQHVRPRRGSARAPPAALRPERGAPLHHRRRRGLRLTRFNGGAKGPVILSPGFGTSSYAYLIDTTDTNYPEYLSSTATTPGSSTTAPARRWSPARRSSPSTTSRSTTIPRRGEGP
jgi:hypothetical protein